MAETLTIRTAASTEVIKIAVQGPQGPAGAPGTGLETLTSQGDTLYRGASTGERLPIGSAGQVLKVVNGLPAWANESGAVSSVAGRTGAVTLNSTDITSEQAIEVYEAGNANCNGFYIYGGLFNGRPTYYATKDTFIYWDGSNWIINHNGDDQYFGSAAIRPWDSVWSLGEGSNPLPVVDQVSSRVFEQVVGQRTNPTARGDAASKNVGTGANDVAAGNHTHSAATQSVAGFLSAADKTKLDGIAAGAEVNVNADWNATSGDAQILNKPTIPAASTATPSALGTSAAGTSSNFARADHVHAMPSAADVGAAAATHASTHAAGRRAIFVGTVAGMTTPVTIQADNAGTAGNSITLSFNGSSDIDTVISSWNSANPSNTADVLSGNGLQIPEGGEEINLSQGTAAGSDAIATPHFTNLSVGNGKTLSLGNNYGQFTSASGSAGFTINRGDDSGFASIDLLQFADAGTGWSLQMQPSNNDLRIVNRAENVHQLTLPASGTTAINAYGNIEIANTDNDATATLVAYTNLTDNRTYDLPDADGKLIVSASAPNDGDTLVWDDTAGEWVAAAPTGGVTSYNDLDDLPTLGTAASADIGTGAGDVCAGDDARLSDARTPTSHTHTPSEVGLGNVSNTAQVTSVTGTAPIVSSGGTTPAISISAATTSAAGSMSSADKTKLDGIAAGAEVNVNADWNATSGDAQILNKPTLGTAAAASTSDFAAASHSHELTALAATGATNGHVLTANGSGGVTFAAAAGGTPADNSISNAKLSQVATATIKGRTTAGTGNVEDLTASQARGVLALATTDNVTFGSLQGTPVGSTTASSGAFTSLTSNVGTITANTPVTITQTWNNDALNFAALDIVCVNTASASGSAYLNCRASAGGANQFQLRRGGAVMWGQTAGSLGDGANTIVLYNSGALSWSSSGGVNANQAIGDTILRRDAANTLAMYNTSNAQTFRLYSTFSSTTSFERLNIAAQTGGNFILGTEKGSGGGTARGLELRTDNVARITIGSAGQLGFFGATAAAQPTAVADATDAATVITQLNALLSRMRTLGLIAT